MTSKASKILGLFLVLTLGFIIFLARVFDVATSDRYKNISTKKEVDTPLRGDIITADGYHVAKSQKRYSVVVEPESIDPNKQEVFVKLIAVYAKKSEAELYKLLDSDKKVTIISGIDARDAKNFRQLSSVLDKLQVFMPKKIGNKFVRYGLEIAENEFFREYPFVDAIEPLIGYIKVEDLSGLLGLEKFYESALSGTQKGLTEGSRDVGGNIIYNERSKNSYRQDGLSVKIFIHLKLQKIIEKHLDAAKKELNADSLLACVMDSSTGKIVAMASSNRYEPYNVPKEEIANMKVDFVQYVYEPGSTIKPIVFAMLLEEKKLSIMETIDCKLGHYQLGQKLITDEHKMGVVPVEDAIIYSSNVGMAQLSQRMDSYSYQEWLKKFGFEHKSGIDLPFELPGNLPKKAQLSNEMTKGILGYGYGMRANFVQLMAAYNIFNNKGVYVTPRITESILIDGGEQKLPAPNKKIVISESTAAKMKTILKKVVEKGTGTDAKVAGLEIGGKTGTAHIAKNGVYAKAFNSSFFGFINDGSKTYTVGVLVIEPKNKHFAAATAVPVFKKIAISMQEEGFLAKP
jgi:cell division protein FtsI (penicillin-binding protein 3)